MANYHPVDRPPSYVTDEESDDLDFDSPTEADREVLNEDELSEALDGRSRKSRKGRKKQRNEYIELRKPTTRASNWNPHGSSSSSAATGESSSPQQDDQERRLMASQRPSRNARNSAYDDDSDDSEDLEIDLEYRPFRRRRLRKGSRFGITLVTVVSIICLTMVSKMFVFDEDSWYHRHWSHTYKHDKQTFSNGTHEFYPTTIVLSLDGFHPHYVSEELTPRMNKIFGVSGAPYMTPQMPSSTFPNHWTMVTGLRPGQHGIVGNTFYDPTLERQFINVDPDIALDSIWWGGEPVWVTADKYNVSSAIHMWPGSEAFPDYDVAVYNASETLDEKRDVILGFLDRDLDSKEGPRPELILSYVPLIDTLGHEFGIAGPHLRQGLKRVDALIGQIIDGIDARNLSDHVNLMIVSDHGMAPTSNERLVYLEDYLDLSLIAHSDGWPLVGIRPKSGHSAKDLLKSITDSDASKEGFDAYLLEDVPKEYYFSGDYSHRFAPLWIIPKVGWSVTTRDQMAKMNEVYTPFGVHGYNKSESLMRALFIGRGPYFDQMFRPMSNVQLYNIICDTLNISPAPNDGDSVRWSLRSLPSSWRDEQSYPGVAFDTEILKVESTFDDLWGSRASNVTEGASDDNESTDDGKGKGVWSSIENAVHGAYEGITGWFEGAMGWGN